MEMLYDICIRQISVLLLIDFLHHQAHLFSRRILCTLNDVWAETVCSFYSRQKNIDPNVKSSKQLLLLRTYVRTPTIVKHFTFVLSPNPTLSLFSFFTILA